MVCPILYDLNHSFSSAERKEECDRKKGRGILIDANIENVLFQAACAFLRMLEVMRTINTTVIRECCHHPM